MADFFCGGTGEIVILVSPFLVGIFNNVTLRIYLVGEEINERNSWRRRLLDIDGFLVLLLGALALLLGT